MSRLQEHKTLFRPGATMHILFLKKWCHQNQGRGSFRRDEDSWHLELEKRAVPLQLPQGSRGKDGEQAGSPKQGPLSNR